MSIVCIPKEISAKIKSALKDKDITLGDLFKLRTPEERIAYLQKYAGDSAKDINTLFEQKLILKNQLAGLKNFIDKITNSGRYNEAKKAEIAKSLEDFKAKQLERIFNPKEGEAFLGALAEKITGSAVTEEQVGNIAKMTIAVSELKKGFDGEKWVSDQAKIDYGAMKVISENYISDLKEGGLTLRGMLQERLGQFKQEFKTNKPLAIGRLLTDTLKLISNNSISLVASVDNSFLGRQGLKTLMTHPSVWWDGAKNSFTDIAKTMGGKNMKDALMADIYSNPNYLNGNYELAKLIPRSEEQYPTTLPERIWGVGRVLKASEVAFTGSAIRMRTGLFDLLSEVAKKNEVDMTDKYQVQSLGKMINSLTARGQWGKTGEPAIVRIFFWAPRMLKGNIDVLTVHLGQDISPFARKQAAINLVKIVGTTAGVIAIANAIKPGSAETDPRSTDFGKIKVGNTRFDLTGGAGSLIVLASRIATGSSKSATTGLISPLGSGYGQTSGMDLVTSFLEGKTTPPVGIMIDFLKGQTITGQKPTILGELLRGITPISIQNIIQLKDDNSVSAVAGVLADAIGFNANTYTSTTDWGQNTGVELQQFKTKVGDVKFKEANDKFNQQYADWFATVKSNPKYLALADEQKKTALTNKKAKIKSTIFQSYGFHYKQVKSKPLPKL